MSDEQVFKTTTEQDPATPRWVGLVVAVLAAVSLLGLGTAWTASTRAKELEQTLQAQNCVAEKETLMAKRKKNPRVGGDAGDYVRRRMAKEAYKKQVALLLNILPEVAKERNFAGNFPVGSLCWLPVRLAGPGLA